MLQAQEEGWFCIPPSPAVVSPKHPQRLAQLSTPPFLPPGTHGGRCRVLPASSLHLGRTGSSKHPSHATCSGSRAVPTTPSLRGSPGPLQMPPAYPAGGSPSTQRGPRRHGSQHRELSRATMVLSCSSPSAAGNRRASTGIFFCFFPLLPLLQNHFRSVLCLDLPSRRGQHPRARRSPSSAAPPMPRAGCCLALPGGAGLSGTVWGCGAGRGARGDSEHSWSSSSRVHLSPLCFSGLCFSGSCIASA